MASIFFPRLEWPPRRAEPPATAPWSSRDGRRRPHFGARCLPRTLDTAHGPSAPRGPRLTRAATTSNRSGHSSRGIRSREAPTARADGAAMEIDRASDRRVRDRPRQTPRSPNEPRTVRLPRASCLWRVTDTTHAPLRQLARVFARSGACNRPRRPSLADTPASGCEASARYDPSTDSPS